MDSYILRGEHEEFVKRMEEEHKRQNQRLGELEETVRQIGELTVAVKEIAIGVKNVTEEQKELRNDVEEIKARDGEMWRKVVGYIATAIAGIIIGFIFRQLGM